MDSNTQISSIAEVPQSLEKPKTPIALSTITYIQSEMATGLHTDSSGLRSNDGVVITSNTAIKSFEAIMNYKEEDSINFDELQIEIGDLDFYYFNRRIWDPDNLYLFPSSGKSPEHDYDDFIHKVQRRFNWLSVQRDEEGEISETKEGGLLNHIPIQDFKESLKHAPISPKWYSGFLKIPERDLFEVEITDQMLYRHGDNIYAMKFNTSGFLTFTDEEGRELKLLNMAQASVQKFAYGNSHLIKGINAINLHTKYEGGDFYSLANTAHEVCPYIAKDYVLFLLNNIQEGMLDTLGMEKYFGSKTLTAIEATYKMVDTMDSNIYTYHNYFNHILLMVKDGKKKLESHADSQTGDAFGIQRKYFEDLLLAIYAHESGIEKSVPMMGHEGRGAEKIQEEKVASLLIGATKLEKLPEEDRTELIGVRSIRSEIDASKLGFTLVPMCYLEGKRKKLQTELIGQGVEPDQADKMIYFISLMDVGNILTVGNINKTMEILIENAIEKKDISSPFVKDQMNLYVGLFANLRDFIGAKMNSDTANANFKEVFIPFFMDINGITEEEMSWEISQGSYSDKDDYIRGKLNEIIDEKIQIWSYIGDHADNNMLPKMLKIITETSDPEARSIKIMELNSRLSVLVAKAQMDIYKDK
jgi:hypothetical protein